ncbi:MAG: VOC family protein, partial [Chloroflexi bacterium]|nr:VOC family protein [Chloroflexota bacterium]
MAVEAGAKFDVGGIELDRPFKIRRLGHFGVNVRDTQASLDFYTKLLGFRVSDTQDFGRILGMMAPDRVAGLGDGLGWFMRHGTDHHSFVIFPRPVYEAVAETRAGRPVFAPDNTINQITWQLGSMREVS